MSWNVTFIGKPENVIKALEENSTKLADYSKEEYDAVLPHLVGLVKQNFNINPDLQPVVKIEAAGHGLRKDGNDEYRQCTAKVENLYGVLV